MSEHQLRVDVAVRDRASGRYLGAGTEWIDDPAHALRLDELEASTVVGRFACEADALELVPASALDDERACRAVA